eukprot:jgi/Botrbrau1/23096/Bobra.0243s0033.1
MLDVPLHNPGGVHHLMPGTFFAEDLYFGDHELSPDTCARPYFFYSEPCIQRCRLKESIFDATCTLDEEIFPDCGSPSPAPADRSNERLLEQSQQALERLSGGDLCNVAVGHLVTAFTAASRCWDSMQLQQLDWGRVPDEGCLMICTELHNQGAGLAEWKRMLSAIILPKFLALTTSASQSLISAFVETGQANPHALVDAVLQPGMRATSLTGAQCELISKTIRANSDRTAGTTLAQLLTAHVTSKDSLICNWNENSVSLLLAIIALRPPFTQGEVELLLKTLVNASHLVQLQKSIKLAKAIMNLLAAYPSMVTPHFGTLLVEAADSNSSFMSKSLRQKALSMMKGIG